MSPGPPLTTGVLTVLTLLPAAPAHAVGEAGAARYSARTVLLWVGAVALVVVLVLLVSRYLARRRFLAQLDLGAITDLTITRPTLEETYLALVGEEHKEKQS